MKILYFLLTLFLLLPALSCSRSEQGPRKITTQELTLAFSAEKQEDKLSVKLTFDVSPGWHIYGPNGQKNGRPTTAEFFADDKKIIANEWPATKTFDEGESGLSEGFDGHFEVKASFEDPRADIELLRAKITWVACKDICMPGEAELRTTVSR